MRITASNTGVRWTWMRTHEICRPYETKTLEEASLPLKERSYRELFEYDLDGLFSLDLGGRIVSANEACKELLGYGVGDLLGTTFAQFVVPEDLERLSEGFSQAIAGESRTVEASVVHMSANRVKLHMAIVPIMVEEKVIGVSIIARDITGRRRL